jgi:hypothetical protein
MGKYFLHFAFLARRATPPAAFAHPQPARAGWRWLTGLLAAALSAASANAAADPAPGPTQIASPKVRLRIAPDVARQWPELHEKIVTSGVAEIAEPADLLLTTGDELYEYAELDPVAGSDLNVVRLGKLPTGEAQSALPGVLALLQRQKALIALTRNSRPERVEACKVDNQRPDKCLTDGAALADWVRLGTAVRNRSGRPRFVAILEASADLGIKVNTLRGQQSVVKLAPGEHFVLPPSGFTTPGTSHQIVLVSNEPFDPMPFAQPRSLGSSITCYVRLYPDCIATAPPPVSTSGLFGIDLVYADQDRAYDAEEAPPPAMGGGYPVTRGDADWMVELYSTRPYSPQEIEDDKKLPAAERKYLAERTPEERAHACGGTMLAANLVLTAAHCVATGRFLQPNEARLFKDRRVRVGSLRLGRGGETRAIVGAVIHAGYTGKGSGLPNDIALLLVKSDEQVRIGARALKVAGTAPMPGRVVTGLGWGYTHSVAPGANLLMSMSNEVQRNPQTLQQAPLEVLAAPTCIRRVEGKWRPGMLCLVTPKAVAASGGAATFSCRGDSGGPLVRNYGSSREELVGLTSWSLGCGYKDTPSIYTDAAHFSSWVETARRAIRAGAVIRVGDTASSR